MSFLMRKVAHCDVCGHEWLTNKVPTHCAKCKSRKWNSGTRKREIDGRYAFDGKLERICVCGHSLGTHSAGSPSDCLFYSLPKAERDGLPGADSPECNCAKFRMSRKRGI